jgi:hypothetical protein
MFTVNITEQASVQAPSIYLVTIPSTLRGADRQNEKETVGTELEGSACSQ